MDASIRLHLRQQSDAGSDGDSIVPILPPENTFQDYDDFDVEPQIPVLVAELIENDPEDENKQVIPTAPSQNQETQNEIPQESNQNNSNTEPNEWPRRANARRNPRCLPVKKKNRFKTDLSVSRFIVTRTSLPYTIEHNEMTLEWSAFINTCQDAVDMNDTERLEETVVTVVTKSIEEAREACHTFAPPRMHSFEDSPKCHICKKSFNKIIRRPCHCKNCGVCICSSCTRNWPSSMLPITFHANKRSRVFKVCMACDWLNLTFRQSLLSGNFDKAVALQSTGNVNTRNPFASVRGETYYPVHCAVLGGNLAIFKWLVDSLCCPIQSKRRLPLRQLGASMGNEKVVTSRGKSVLDLAMESSQLGILHFLVIEKGVNILEYKNLMVALRTLKTTLNHLPEHLK